MTVASTARKQQFTLNGTISTLTFTFRALVSSPSDIKVITTVGGTDTTLAYTTDYSVSVNADGVGGVVTLVNPAAIGSGIATVYRETTNTQNSDYDDYNQFPADTIETDLDIRTMVSQELSEESDRTLKLAISSSASADLPAPEASKLLGWNGAGDAITNYTPSPGTALNKASQAEAEAGTDNTAYMTPLRTTQAPISGAKFTSLASIPVGAGVIPAANLPTSTKYKIGTFDRDMTAGSGDVSYTGVGFTPKAILLIGIVQNGTNPGLTIGLDDATNHYQVAFYNASTANTVYCLYLTGDNGATNQSALVKSFNADGFTLTWTKTGTCGTATAHINYIALA